ncbi:hypothetical protein EJ110_NYTH05145 [Nymphaea thermarum]|nr:hypothetical protein EJ110_NYTH05145 [Nymphaea thermarum]
MAGAWDSLLRSLQCKSQAFSDVFQPSPLKPLKPSNVPNSGCSKSVRNLKDVVLVNPSAIPRHHLHHPHHRHDDQHHHYLEDGSSDTSFGSNKKKKKKAKKNKGGEGEEDGDDGDLSTNGGYQKLARVRALPGGRGPVLTELPEGHSSRNIVEIIFKTGWPAAGGGAGGGCAIERAFKVTNLPERVARFEEYREWVRSRAGGSARCVADGNEVLRFYSARLACGLARGRTCGGGCAACGLLDRGFRGTAIRVAPSSGRAHQMRARWAVGRRAMLVCRVIAGRSMEEERPKMAVVGKKGKPTSPSLPVPREEGAVFGIPVGYDSVAGVSGELVVFDPRALLPCFLIVYRM